MLKKRGTIIKSSSKNPLENIRLKCYALAKDICIKEPSTQICSNWTFIKLIMPLFFRNQRVTRSPPEIFIPFSVNILYNTSCLDINVVHEHVLMYVYITPSSASHQKHIQLIPRSQIIVKTWLQQNDTSVCFTYSLLVATSGKYVWPYVHSFFYKITQSRNEFDSNSNLVCQP